MYLEVFLAPAGGLGALKGVRPAARFLATKLASLASPRLVPWRSKHGKP